MSAKLLLCSTQEEVDVAFVFKTTNTNVYSLEEALYYVYHNWKQSIDDFASDEFVSWVNDILGLSYIATKIKKISDISDFSDKLMNFLQVIEFFDEVSLLVLKNELMDWERRQEWEKLKERGDFFMNKNEYTRAYSLYKKALNYGANARIYNNIAIAQMKLKNYKSACDFFKKAYELDVNNFTIITNYTEALILNQDFDIAHFMLAKLETMTNSPNHCILYLNGELNFVTGNIREALDYYEKALSVQFDTLYIYRIVDAYIKMRHFEKALETLDKVKTKDKHFLMKQAEVFYFNNNIPSAIKSIERALINNSKDEKLWIKLALYHKLDYDLNRASSAIIKALNLSKDNEEALLEYARIKKMQGKTKEYQNILNDILNKFKKTYRELS